MRTGQSQSLSVCRDAKHSLMQRKSEMLSIHLCSSILMDARCKRRGTGKDDNKNKAPRGEVAN